MVRALVVDDSAFMRKALSRMLEGDPEIQVAGTARDGIEALEKIKELDPDILTMDVEMPRMDGLEALQRIMTVSPRPVLMVSSLTEEGAEVTLKALDLGAVDYIPKHLDGNVLDIVHVEKVLQEKVKALARKRGNGPPLHAPGLRPAPPLPPRPATERRPRGRLGPVRYVAVGASTGGPPALQKLFAALPPNFGAPLVVVQHMPKSFTGPFAKRLNQVGPLAVKEAETGDRLEPGKGFVAPGGSHLYVRREGTHLVLRVSDEPADTLHKPSVDVTFRSLSETIGSAALAVVLTGMGCDGLEGVRALKAKGAPAIAQDAQSCVVYGMPRAIVEAGLADAVLSVEEMVPVLEGAVG
ncbi:MAG: chemotaxis response regulator protein-glutamate methylesterase [Deltaproteobacteria bacterium]|nr:chemotaxis response regulator protein-glutamate methylesterase [Deltaproteobacteria bacterium]